MSLSPRLLTKCHCLKHSKDFQIGHFFRWKWSVAECFEGGSHKFCLTDLDNVQAMNSTCSILYSNNIYWRLIEVSFAIWSHRTYCLRSPSNLGTTKFVYVAMSTKIWILMVSVLVLFVERSKLCNMAHSKETPKIFLFDSWALWPPEIWHCIFMTNQVSQYVLWYLKQTILLS